MSRLTNEFNAHHPPLSTNHLSEPSSLSPNDTTNKLKTGSDRLAGRGDYDNQHDSDSKETQLEPPSPITTGSNGPLNNAEAVVITPPTSNSTENDATRETLLRNLLDTSSPRLDNKIVGLLSSKGTIQLFMAYFSRVSPNHLSSYPVELISLVKDAQHERDLDDLDAVKRSFYAMEILTGTSASHFAIQDNHFAAIISCLFDVFSPLSHGNFNHFAKIFQHFIRRHPVEMLDYLFLRPDDTDASLFFNGMLPYIHQSAVMDSILAILFVRDINGPTKEKRQEAHARLSTLGLLQWFVKAIEMKHLAPTFAEAAGELLIRMIEETSQVDNGHLLLQVLDQPDQGGKEIMESLVKLVENHRASATRNRVVKILLLLTKSGLLTTRASAVSHPIHGPLYSISVKCQEMLSNHIPELCSVISNDRQSVSSKQLPLTIYDMDLLEVIYSTLPHIRNKTDLIDTIPTAFWRIVVNSFFEKSTSSIYHAQFYRIFCVVLELRYEPLILILIRRQKLVTRMVDLYEDTKQKIDTRGYILLILNYLRLMTDAEPTGVLHRIMESHPRYCGFLPTLRGDTLAQIRFNYTWKLDSCPRPPTHIGPSPPVRSAPYSSFTPTLQLTEDAEENEESGGIDLGSDYAYCMGFDEKPQIKTYSDVPTADVPSPDAPEMIIPSHEFDNPPPTDEFADLWWGESLTADDPYDSAY